MNLIVPEYYKKKKSKKLKTVKNETNLEKAPNPTGWRILILPYRGISKTKGGVLLSDNTVMEQQLHTQVGLVLKMGPDCYTDKEKFPTGPWCKQGDWVIFARYAGSRIKIEGGEVRLLNDDEILATIKNPEDLLHEF